MRRGSPEERTRRCRAAAAFGGRGDALPGAPLPALPPPAWASNAATTPGSGEGLRACACSGSTVCRPVRSSGERSLLPPRPPRSAGPRGTGARRLQQGGGRQAAVSGGGGGRREAGAAHHDACPGAGRSRAPPRFQAAPLPRRSPLPPAAARRRLAPAARGLRGAPARAEPGWRPRRKARGAQAQAQGPPPCGRGPGAQWGGAGLAAWGSPWHWGSAPRPAAHPVRLPRVVMQRALERRQQGRGAGCGGGGGELRCEVGLRGPCVATGPAGEPTGETRKEEAAEVTGEESAEEAERCGGAAGGRLRAAWPPRCPRPSAPRVPPQKPSARCPARGRCAGSRAQSPAHSRTWGEGRAGSVLMQQQQGGARRLLLTGR